MATSVAAPLERHLGQIADVTQMTSRSWLDQTRITLQFDLDRNIDGAARDVQAAINAARADLPTSLPIQPHVQEGQPGRSPILILALTSATMTKGQMYEAARPSAAAASQIKGIGEVDLGGSDLARRAHRTQAVRAVQVRHRARRRARGAGVGQCAQPKGPIENGSALWQIEANDQARYAEDYKPLVVAYRNGAAVRLSDVAEVIDSVEDVRNLGLANGKPSVLVDALSASPAPTSSRPSIG